LIVRGEKAFGVGRARMSGWEMVRSKRGVAVELRSVSQA
jgi:archaeosine synthase